MKRYWRLLALLALFLTGCERADSAASRPEANFSSAVVGERAARGDGTVHLLVLVEGELGLKRPGWDDFHAARFGSTLHAGDLLRLETEGRAVVLCDSLSLWTLPAGETSGVASGCPSVLEPSKLVAGVGLVGATRGFADPDIPYIISPRATLISSGRPWLRWHGLVGVSDYQVRILGEGLRWEAKTAGNQLQYPGDPPLEPGEKYVLSVEADNGRTSGEEQTAGLAFSLLEEQEANALQTQHERLESLGLPRDAEAYALAMLFAGKGLTADAIETLEDLVASGSQEAAVYWQLSELYRQVGLFDEAAMNADRAAAAAETAGDEDALGLAQTSLALTYHTVGDSDQATRWFAKAQSTFGALGDDEALATIGRLMKD